ncbi:LmbU family transcriptional regulator [Micromonospora chersina]|uniref:LmbU family transcriptional regulator n=1 Tax=Micromonospora chersina TaxID=47854 RepID=UPI003712964B
MGVRVTFDTPRSRGVAVQQLVARSGVARQRPLGSGVQVHVSGLLFTSKPSLNKWEQLGAMLFSFADSSAWWIADWLIYGESTFHDRYEEAIKRTSLSYQTLRNYTWVAREFPLPRRRQGVSFSHHLEVVPLERAEQDYWLRKAEEHRWSRNKLRNEIRSSLLTRRSEPTLGETENRTPVDDTDALGAEPDSTMAQIDAARAPESRLLNLQLSAQDLAMIEEVALKDSQSIEAWASMILRRAVESSLGLFQADLAAQDGSGGPRGR